jgi:hypothetical protein
MRNQVFELACLRCGVIAQQGRGTRCLPPAEKSFAANCLPRSLDTRELKRTFQSTVQMLLKEISFCEAPLQAKLAGPLNAMLAC